MTTSKSYDLENYDFEREMRRLQEQARMFWKQEARSLTWFGLQDGMSVLEREVHLGKGMGVCLSSN